MAKTKEEAIEELTNLLVFDGVVISKKKNDFLKIVLATRGTRLTGFENHVAIPHMGKPQAWP